MPTGPGCFAKCLMPDKYDEATELRNEYTGENHDQEGIEFQKVVTQTASTKWVKKKADKNCLSANPDDCLVWCLVDVKEEFVEFYEVIDTHTIKDFAPLRIEMGELAEQGGLTEWRAVVCDNQFNDEMKEDIQLALIELGYLEETNSEEKYNPEVKSSLINFQKANELPVGQLDFETLDALGVSY